jgi:hypothetical protein
VTESNMKSNIKITWTNGGYGPRAGNKRKKQTELNVRSDTLSLLVGARLSASLAELFLRLQQECLATWESLV